MKWLSLSLALVFLSSFCFALPASQSDGSVVLSPAQASSISSALEQAKEALKKSSEEIKKQSRQLTGLWIFSGALLAVDLGITVALVIHEIKEAK
jgi:hypothetical protein